MITNHNECVYVGGHMSDEGITHHKNSVQWDVVAIIAAITLVGVLGPKLLWMLDGYRAVVVQFPIDVQFLIHPMFRMVLALIGWAIVMKRAEGPCRATMGLGVGWGLGLKAFTLGFACTLPMLALGLVSEYSGTNRYDILYGAISPGVMEEIFYRALMFGLLVQIARTPMWTTAIVTGIVFGLAHVDITPDEGETILGQLNMWIAIIALGGFMYAWIFFESRWNLWVVIALHIGMNLWWGMFDLTSSPLGGFGATLSRIVCVGLVVLFVFGMRVLEPRKNPTIVHDATT